MARDDGDTGSRDGGAKETTDEEEQVAKQNYEEKYTHPELREKVKEEIKASDKGGKEGQWSARKSPSPEPRKQRSDGGSGEHRDGDMSRETAF
jgi:hypothetical protein